MVQKLSEFDFDIIYKPSKSNTNADCLSRIPIDDQKNITGSTELWVITRKQFRDQINKIQNNGNNQHNDDKGTAQNVKKSAQSDKILPT